MYRLAAKNNCSFFLTYRCFILILLIQKKPINSSIVFNVIANHNILHVGNYLKYTQYTL